MDSLADFFGMNAFSERGGAGGGAGGEGGAFGAGGGSIKKTKCNLYFFYF